MSSAQDEELDRVLSLWHWKRTGGNIGRGFNDRSLVVGEYLVSRQYDDSNGKLDDDLDERRAKAVDFAVSKMLDPWRAAIYMLARNLYTGSSVWESPRLPQSRIDRERIVFQARRQITRLLTAAGVICEI